MECTGSVLLTDDANKGSLRAKVRCQLGEGHAGKHRRTFTNLGRHPKHGEIVIEWDPNIDYSEDPDEYDIGGQG